MDKYDNVNKKSKINLNNEVLSKTSKDKFKF